jgi:GntR family transcriptional regulator/MocR family aminotransferase
MRRASSWLQMRDNGRGLHQLCVAIADHLASSRGVICRPDQIAIVSGVQQALDLLARCFLKPGDPVWMEDPGYFGAAIAFRNAGAKIVPVPVDSEGIRVPEGRRMFARARCAYVTPNHQFPMGATMSLERRLALLAWASETGALVIEDDYDSEFRFEGRPQPALQGLRKRPQCCIRRHVQQDPVSGAALRVRGVAAGTRGSFSRLAIRHGPPLHKPRPGNSV